MAMLVFGLVIFLGLHSTRIFAESGRRARDRAARGRAVEGRLQPSVAGRLRDDRLGLRAGALGGAADLGAADLDAPHRAAADAVQHDSARRLRPQEEPHRRRRPSPNAVGRRRLVRRSSARQRLGWRTSCCSARSSPGRFSTFQAIMRAIGRRRSSIPRRTGARRSGRSSSASFSGSSFSAGFIAGCSASRRWRCSAECRYRWRFLRSGPPPQGKSPRRRYTRYTRQKIESARRRAHTGMPVRRRPRYDPVERFDNGRQTQDRRRRRGQAPAPLAAVVRQPRQSGHDGALSRALPQFRHHPCRNCAPASRSSASRRRARTFRPATGIISTSPNACATGSSPRAACRSSFRSIRSRRPASGRPRRSTAISPISGWSRS